MVCANLGFVRFRQGDLQEATALFSEGLEIARQLEMRFGIAVHLVGLAGIAIEQGQPTQGARLLGATEAILQEFETQFFGADRADRDHIIATARAQLDESTFDTAWAAGQALSLDEAIGEALNERGQP
jgi:hypothetical protein